MHEIKEQYIIDEKGNKTAVVLSINDYRALLEEIETVEEIRQFDKAINSNDEYLPFDEAMREIGL